MKVTTDRTEESTDPKLLRSAFVVWNEPAFQSEFKEMVSETRENCIDCVKNRDMGGAMASLATADALTVFMERFRDMHDEYVQLAEESGGSETNGEIADGDDPV